MNLNGFNIINSIIVLCKYLLTIPKYVHINNISLFEKNFFFLK